MIPVCWWSPAESFERGFWDQGLLEHLFTRQLWRPAAPMGPFEHYRAPDHEPEGGAILIIAGRWHVADSEQIQAWLAARSWALIIVTGDEEGEFDWRVLQGPARAIWVQTPHPAKGTSDRGLGDYWPAETPRILREIPYADPSTDWFFSGQLNNKRRHECAEVLARMDGGMLVTTEGFGQGLDHDAYLRGLISAKVAPCPSGSFSPDTFRVFEALEAGCIPVVDDAAPNTGPEDYWQALFGDEPPFPVLSDWADFPHVCAELVAGWPANANRVSAWWQAQKRALACDLDDTLRRLGAPISEPIVADDQITVIVPTSPIISHPDTSIIEETIGSIRDRLPLAEIIIAFDGVRAEQEHLRVAYETYQRRLLWLCEHRWYNVLPVRHETHAHQSGMMRRVLGLVRTPTVLFVEHDTPLVGDIPFPELADVILAGEACHIRLHYDTDVHPEHEYLYLDKRGNEQYVNGVPLLRTAQWSQRPHLASTSYYRTMIELYFSATDRWMIEDRLHGVVGTAFDSAGEDGWARHRLWVYAPAGNMQRSIHLDARAGEPKWVDS